MKNPQLNAIEQKLEQSVPVQGQQAFQRIVAAGVKIMFDPTTHAQIFNGALDGNIPGRLAIITVAVVKMIQKESQGMPMDVAMIATVDLYLHALDFAAAAGKLQINPQTLKSGLEALARLMQQQLQAGAQASQDQPPGSAPPQTADAATGAPAPTPPTAPQGGM